MAPQRILIFAEDPRLCRLLLREANAAGFEGLATTERDKLETHYRNLVADIIFMEVDGRIDGLASFLQLMSACQRGSLVLLTGVDGIERGEIMKVANARGVKIGGILQKPMGIEAIRAVLRRQNRVTSSVQPTANDTRGQS